MGTVVSKVSILQPLLSDFRRHPGNVVNWYLVAAHDHLYLFIGERHNVGHTPFLNFLTSVLQTCTDNMDLFIEGSTYMREEYRTRTKTRHEDVQLEDHFNTLQVVGAVAEMACDNVRVHAVDPRDQGFMEYALNPDVPKSQAVTSCYALSMLTNLEYTVKLSRSSAKKSDDPTAVNLYIRQIASLVDKTAKVEVPNLDKLWSAYARLVDMYTLARMLRNDNHPLRIFYGGANHSVALFEAMRHYVTGVKIIDFHAEPEPPTILRTKDERKTGWWLTDDVDS